ncbi:MAG: hypothetical protein JNG88_19355, partial [Phycisphaerales bacterium]|nr:hypothetical protein [Phycisphaerales bacterium]
MTRSKMLLLAVIAASLAGTGYWYQSIRQSTASTAARTVSPVPVTVARATLGDIPILLEV